MRVDQSSTTSPTVPTQAHLVVTRAPDGRYSVTYNNGDVSRHSYTSSMEQVIRQAQRAGHIPVQTDDPELRQGCQDASLPLF
jgi:hypothetical protein